MYQPIWQWARNVARLDNKELRSLFGDVPFSSAVTNSASVQRPMPTFGSGEILGA